VAAGRRRRRGGVVVAGVGSADATAAGGGPPAQSAVPVVLDFVVCSARQPARDQRPPANTQEHQVFFYLATHKNISFFLENGTSVDRPLPKELTCCPGACAAV
jgi:hypothetical protein